MEKEEEEHYYRLICLVVDIGTEVLLNLFKKCIPTSQTPEAFLNNRMHKIYPPKGRKVLNELQYKALTVAPIDMSKFDITLLCVLIRNLTNIQAPNGGWDTKTLSATDTSPGALIINLRGIRNGVIAHRSKGKLTKTEFEKYWRETEGILVDLSDHAEKAAVKKKIAHAKIKQLVEDPKVKENELAIGKLQEDYSDLAATVDQIKQKVEELESKNGDVSLLKSSIDDLEVQMKGLENRMTQADDKATKVDQQLDRVSADMEKIESSLQELKTEVQNGFKKVDKRLDDLSAVVQKHESSLQKLSAITIIYDRQEENRRKRKGEELDETVPSQLSNKQFKSSNTADSGIHTESEQHGKSPHRRLGLGDQAYDEKKQRYRRSLTKKWQMASDRKVGGTIIWAYRQSHKQRAGQAPNTSENVKTSSVGGQ